MRKHDFGLCETSKLKMYHFHCKYTFGTLEIAKLLSIDIYGLFYEINIGKPKY